MKNEVNKEDTNKLELINETAIAIKEPSLYQVIIHNDDFTPMEFVLKILEVFFFHGRLKASEIMFEAHIKGKAVCGIFPRDLAETKVKLVIDYAQLHGHPLHCNMEVS